MGRRSQQPLRIGCVLLGGYTVFSLFLLAGQSCAAKSMSSDNMNTGWFQQWSLPQLRRSFPGKAYAMDDDDEVSAHLSNKSVLLGGVGRELSLFDNTQVYDDDDDDNNNESSATITPAIVRIRSLDGATTTATSAASAPAAAKSPTTATTTTTTNTSYRPKRFYDDASAHVSASTKPIHTPNNYFRTGGRSYSTGGGGSSTTSSSSSSSNRYHHRNSSHHPQQKQKPSMLHPVTDWWSAHVSPNMKNWPKIQCRIEPTTTLKIRKTFRPLKTIVRLSAHFNTQRGVWQFKSSWEDAIIGGKLTLAGRKELQLTKSWQLSVGPVEDLVTRLRLRAAVDLQTWKAYVRVGFRTERLSPINVMEGFSLVKQIPLDGVNGKVKLEVKANFALPEPEIEYSTETQRSLIGMGDIEVGIEELNLLLDY